MQPPEDPRAALRRLYRLREPTISSPPPELEERLLAAHGRLHPPARRDRFWSFLGAHRFAVAGGALALAIGACQIPSEYQRSFGVRVECAVDPALAEGPLEGAVDALREAIEADNVSIRVLDDGGATLSLQLDAWGPTLDPETTLAAVKAASPALAAAACEAEALEGTVHGTVGGHLGYALLHLDLDHEDADVARARILEELSAQGFTGRAEVEVTDEMGRRRVEIRIEEEHGEEELVRGDDDVRPIERRVKIEAP